MASWEKRADVPAEHGMAAGGSGAKALGGLVLVGGMVGETPSSAISLYDPASDEWLTSSLATPVLGYGFAGCEVDGVLYWYDSVTDTMRSLNESMVEGSHPGPSVPISDLGHLVGVNGRVYSLSGSPAEAFNPATNSWSAITPAPIQLLMPSVAADQLTGIIYVQAINPATFAMWMGAYDTNSDSWVELTPDTHMQSNASGFVRYGKVYLIGGAAPLSSVGNTNIRVYDIATDSWSGISAPAPMEGAETMWSDFIEVNGVKTIFTLAANLDTGEQGLFSLVEDTEPPGELAFATSTYLDPWATESVQGGTLRGYDVDGKQLWVIPGFGATRVAFDPVSGNFIEAGYEVRSVSPDGQVLWGGPVEGAERPVADVAPDGAGGTWMVSSVPSMGLTELLHFGSAGEPLNSFSFTDSDVAAVFRTPEPFPPFTARDSYPTSLLYMPDASMLLVGGTVTLDVEVAPGVVMASAGSVVVAMDSTTGDLLWATTFSSFATEYAEDYRVTKLARLPDGDVVTLTDVEWGPPDVGTQPMISRFSNTDWRSYDGLVEEWYAFPVPNVDPESRGVSLAVGENSEVVAAIVPNDGVAGPTVLRLDASSGGVLWEGLVPDDAANQAHPIPNALTVAKGRVVVGVDDPDAFPNNNQGYYLLDVESGDVLDSGELASDESGVGAAAGVPDEVGPPPDPEPELPEWELLPSAPPTHGDMEYAGMGRHGDKLILVGGYRTRAVSSFDPEDGAWTSLPDLDSNGQLEQGRAVVIGDTAYWLDFGTSRLRSYDLAAGAEGPNFSRPPGSIGGQGNLEVVNGFIYSLRGGYRFNPAVAFWQAITPVPNGTRPPSTAADEGNGVIYAQTYSDSTEEMWFGVYDVNSNTWTALTPDTERIIGSGGVVHEGRVYFAGGFLVDGGNSNKLRVYDIATDSWSAGRDVPLAGSQQRVVTSEVIPDGNDVLLVSYAVDYNEYTGAFHAYRFKGIEFEEVESFLDVSVNIRLDVDTTEANLTIEVDVPSGQAVVSDLLITFTTGSATIEANALVTVSIPGGEEPPSWPPVAASGENPLLPPRTPTRDEEPKYPRLHRCDEYSLSWGPGSQVAGSASILGGPDSDPQPPLGLMVEGEPETTLEWGEQPPSTTTNSWESVTARLANSHELPELMPVPATEDGEGVDCLKPHGAVLCGGSDPIERCMELELVDELLPSRLRLAQAAVEDAGLSLIVLHGVSGLTRAHDPVSRDYRTEGKTPMQVVADLLLGGGALHWFAPGLVIINGGGLPGAGPFVVPSLRGMGGSITQVNGEPFDEPEPLLEDYLEECREEGGASDPCDGETFETAFSGTLSWVEKAGEGSGYSEVHNTIVKEEGRIVREEITVYRAKWSLDTRPAGRFSEGMTAVVVPTEWTIREHTYLACCPEALSHTLERTWVSKSNLDPEATYEDAARVYLSSYKEVTQEWHAEGWLRSRLEASHTHHSWVVGTVGGEMAVTPTYKTSLRSETYVPVGGGMWHINTRVSDSVLMNVGDVTGEPVGSHWGDVTNSYTVVTDASPPQVSCGGDDEGCREGDCFTRKEEDFQRAYEDWEALRDSWEANNPTRRVTSVTYSGRVTHLQPGDVWGGGIITAMSWSGSGPRTGSPGETTTIERVGRVG